VKAHSWCTKCKKPTSERCWECGKLFCDSHLKPSKRRDPIWKVCNNCEVSHMSEPLVYRANIKTAKGNQYAFALGHKCFGFGWQVDGGTTGMEWEHYRNAAEKQYGKNPAWSRYMTVIHQNLAPGDFIWTRDEVASFYLGRIASRWHYAAEEEYKNADLANICDCEWVGPYTLDDVPGSLMQCRGPFRIVTDERLVEYTKLLYCEATAMRYAPRNSDGPPNLFKWLSDSACEDLVAMYLQQELGYSIIPSTSKHSTAKYEFAMIQRESGEEAAVQVKNGSTSLYCPDYASAGFKVYLFTSGGEYKGDIPPNVETLAEGKLLDFATKHRSSLPKTIRRWVNYLYSQ